MLGLMKNLQWTHMSEGTFSHVAAVIKMLKKGLAIALDKMLFSIQKYSRTSMARTSLGP